MTRTYCRRCSKVTDQTHAAGVIFFCSVCGWQNQGPSPRLNQEQIAEVRKLDGEMGKAKIAKKYGVSVDEIYRVTRRTK